MKDTWVVLIAPAAVCVVTAILFGCLYAPLTRLLNAYISEFQSEGDTSPLVFAVTTGLSTLAALPAFWVGWTLFIRPAFKGRVCATCGAILSYVKIGIGEHTEEETYHVSQKFGEETIGSVYVDGEKVGTVTRSTSWDEITTTKKSTYRDKCECIFCKTQKDFVKNIFISKDKKVS